MKTNINGLWYETKFFYSVKETNIFLEANPNYGMLAERNGRFYVAKNDDKGETKKLLTVTTKIK